MMPEFVSEVLVGLFALGWLLLFFHHELQIRDIRKGTVEAIADVRKETVEMVRTILVGASSWEEARAKFREEFPDPRDGSISNG